MRLLIAAVLLTFLVTMSAGTASAQTTEANGPTQQRMGLQLRAPSFLRSSLSSRPSHQPLRGYTPAHLKNGGKPRPVTQPTLATPPGGEPEEVVQTQAIGELPTSAEMIQPGQPTPSHEYTIIPEGKSVLVDSTPMDIDFEVTGETLMQGDDCCGGPSCGGCNSCCLQLPPLCLPRFSAENLSFFGGVQGFKGPVNRGEDGSFGFSEGFNWGTPIAAGGMNLGAQFGLRAVQTNLHGSEFTSENRSQLFITAGLFRRADCGIQFGGVVDFLHDDWYAQSDLTQFRGEVSWLNGQASEIGFMLTGGGQDEASTGRLFDDQNAPFTVTETRLTNDYYAFFYRHQLDCGTGSWRLFGGFTDDSEGILGADADVSLSNCWSLQSNFTYLIPQENNTAGGNLDESWNVGISLVFHPWGGNRRPGNYYRPLFNVADNGSLLVDIK